MIIDIREPDATVPLARGNSLLISALRSRNGTSFELLSRIGTPGWRLHISTAQLLEYEEVAAAMYGPEFAREVMGFLDLATAAGSVRRIAPSFHFRIITSDPDDDIFAGQDTISAPKIGHIEAPTTVATCPAHASSAGSR